MAVTRPRKIFVNLPVQNLDKSVDFFTRLGFEFNPQFTDENATCMVLSEDGYVMLLVEEFFKTFTKKDLADTTTTVEAILALSADSREDVDEFADKALAAGAQPANEPSDQGFMYGRSFYDLDGHMWEIFWMDPSTTQG
jgi:predicted lactoylglutathione lyase